MTSKVKVIGYHIDVFRHVNNARYLEFYEIDRWAWGEKYKIEQWSIAHGIAMVAVNINVNYHLGAVLGDELTINSRLKSIGEKSAVFYQQITRERDGVIELVSDATMISVLIDLATHKSIVINDELRSKLMKTME
nr:YbgC/FadM family acyl-CoA thioesterase [uncultured Moellerella sp.]